MARTINHRRRTRARRSAGLPAGPPPCALATGTNLDGERYTLARYGTAVVLRVDGLHAWDAEMADEMGAREEYAALLEAMETPTATDRHLRG